MKKEFGLQSLTSLTITFSKPHSWFLELLYLIINANSNSAIQPNHKNTNLGVIPKTNSTEIQLRKSKLIMKQQSQKPRTLHLGCHRTHPSDRSCTLAQEYWREWSGWSRQKHTLHTCSICVTWRNTMWDRGARCLALLAHHGPNRDGIMKAVAIHGFKTRCRQHQHTFQNDLPKWHLCHWSVNHLTNHAHIPLQYECSRKPVLFSPSERLH